MGRRNVFQAVTEKHAAAEAATPAEMEQTPAQEAEDTATPSGHLPPPTHHVLAAQKALRERRNDTAQPIRISRIGQSAFPDRIDVQEDLDVLIASIRDQGLQTPITVRPVRDRGEIGYEVVMGRRRLAAHIALGHENIQAFVRQMSDEEAFLSQGVENNIRRQTSFIERGRLAALALQGGLSQDHVAQFLGVSQSLVSRMASVYSSLGEEIVLAIGSAPNAGRRRWEGLIQSIRNAQLDAAGVIQMIDRDKAGSDDRFAALEASLASHIPAGKKQIEGKATAPTLNDAPAPADETAARRDAPAGVTEIVTSSLSPPPPPQAPVAEGSGSDHEAQAEKVKASHHFGAYSSEKQGIMLRIRAMSKGDERFMSWLQDNLDKLIQAYESGK